MERKGELLDAAQQNIQDIHKQTVSITPNSLE